MAGLRYNAAHWGVYEVDPDNTGAPLAPWRDDPSPSPIGLDQRSAQVMSLRVTRPAVRASWRVAGYRAPGAGRGEEGFVEISWDEATDLIASELERVRAEHGSQAIFGGSYGWASAGRFHHAQSQLHRFLNLAGGYTRSVDSYSLGAGRALMPEIIASMDELSATATSWDVIARSTTLFVTFGGVPEKNAQVSPGGAGRHRVKAGLRQAAAAGVRFVNERGQGEWNNRQGGILWDQRGLSGTENRGRALGCGATECYPQGRFIDGPMSGSKPTNRRFGHPVWNSYPYRMRWRSDAS